MRNRWQFLVILRIVAAWLGIARGGETPRQVPAQHSTDLRDGSGMNQTLSCEPHLPWSRRWWTRLFDSRVKCVRPRQYQNSSDMTSRDWVELPETVAELRATRTAGKVQLDWESYGESLRTGIQRSINFKPWQAAGDTAPDQSHFEAAASGQCRTTYRVRALGKAGASAWSNPAWVEPAR